MTESVKKLKEWVDNACGIVFFGGAGVSTESGIPDFRSTGGLYHQEWADPPEVILSHSFYKSNPEEFFRFYRAKLLAPEAKPNAAHRKLAEWEAAGKLTAVVTQNIDGLHQAAGSKTVYELHGSTLRNYCPRCKKQFPTSYIAQSHGVPYCDEKGCDGIVRPDVVLYEEPLDEAVLEAAVDAIARASLLVVAGTSLVVYPAAGLLRYFQGSHLAIVNLSPTAADKNADLCIPAKVGDVFGW